MKKTLLALSLSVAGALCFSSVQAHDATIAGGFVEGHVGNTHEISENNNHFGFGASVGYLWSLDEHQSLGLEGGYEHFAHENVYFGNESIDFDAYAVTAGARYEYGFWNGAYMFGRLGYARGGETASAGSNGTWVNESRYYNGGYAGIGAGFRVTQNLGLNAAYNYYRFNDDGAHPSAGVVSVGVSYTF